MYSDNIWKLLVNGNENLKIEEPKLIEVVDNKGVYEPTQLEILQERLHLVIQHQLYDRLLNERNLVVLRKNYLIDRSLLDKEFHFYNGQKLQKLKINQDMIGCRVGQFILTKRLTKKILHVQRHRQDNIDSFREFRAKVERQQELIQQVEAGRQFLELLIKFQSDYANEKKRSEKKKQRKERKKKDGQSNKSSQ